MDRYKIALNKKPDLKKSKEVLTFGFGNESVGQNARFELFRPSPGSTHRIGIVYHDSNKLFVATNVHFHNRYFLCKSTQGGRKEVCCERKGKPLFRIACVIIDYGEPPAADLEALNNFRVLPWTFPRKVYLNLNELHKQFSLDAHDFIVKLAPNDQFKNYDLMPLDNSIWQDSNKKDEIINTAIPMINNLKQYLGADLIPFEIGQLLDHPDRFNRRSRMSNANSMDSLINNRLDQI